MACDPGSLPPEYNDEFLRGLLPRELEGAVATAAGWSPDRTAIAVTLQGSPGPRIYIVESRQGIFCEVGVGTMPAWRPSR